MSSSIKNPQEPTVCVWRRAQPRALRTFDPGLPVVPMRLLRLPGYRPLGTTVAPRKRSGPHLLPNTNPQYAPREKIRDLEGAEAVTSFSQAMAAISARLSLNLPAPWRSSHLRSKTATEERNNSFTEFLPPFEWRRPPCGDTSDFTPDRAEIETGLQALVSGDSHNPTAEDHRHPRLAKGGTGSSEPSSCRQHVRDSH